MLADTRRIRLLIAGGLILGAAILLRVLTGAPQEDPDVITGVRLPTSAEETTSTTGPADRATDGGDHPQADVDQALRVVEAFAAEYLTWDPEETHADRLDRLTEHTTTSLAEALRDAHDQAGGGQGLAQSADVGASQTLTVRRHQIEATVAADVVFDDTDPVPTNLTVVLRQEAGRWVVDDLR